MLKPIAVPIVISNAAAIDLAPPLGDVAGRQQCQRLAEARIVAQAGHHFPQSFRIEMNEGQPQLKKEKNMYQIERMPGRSPAGTRRARGQEYRLPFCCLSGEERVNILLLAGNCVLTQ
jgi:hypothetical protein